MLIKKPVKAHDGTLCHNCYEYYNELDQIHNDTDIAQYICPLHSITNNHYYAFMINGSYHRDNGPARIWDTPININYKVNYYKEYWTNGNYLGYYSTEELIIKQIIE